MIRISGDRFIDGVTPITSTWLNSVQEEICAVIVEAGIFLDAEQWGQLSEAIQSIRETITPERPWYDVTDYGATALPLDRGMSWLHITSNWSDWTDVPRIAAGTAYSDDQTPYFKAAFDAAMASMMGYGLVISPPGMYDLRTQLVVGDAAHYKVRRVMFNGYISTFRCWAAVGTDAIMLTETAVANTSDPVMPRFERMFMVSVNGKWPLDFMFKIPNMSGWINNPSPYVGMRFLFKNISGRYFDYSSVYTTT